MPRKETFTHIALTTHDWHLGNGIEDAAWLVCRRAGAEWMLKCGVQIFEFSRPVTGEEVQIHHWTGEPSVPFDVDFSVGTTEYLMLTTDDAPTLALKRQRVARLLGFRKNIQDHQVYNAYARLIKKREAA